MKKLFLILAIFSFLLFGLLFGSWLVHDFFTGAMLPTWQDPTPEIQASMQTHVPISQWLLISWMLSLLASIVFLIVVIFIRRK